MYQVSNCLSTLSESFLKQAITVHRNCNFQLFSSRIHQADSCIIIDNTQLHFLSSLHECEYLRKKLLLDLRESWHKHDKEDPEDKPVSAKAILPNKCL